MRNIYSSPEAFGLEVIGEVEFSSGSYEFDTSVLWRETSTGRLLVGDDGGCSCPCPFESVGVDDLTEVIGLQQLIDYLEERKAEAYYYKHARASIDAAVGELIVKYREAVSS